MSVLKDEIGLGSLGPSANGTELVPGDGVIEVDVRALFELFVADFRFFASGKPGGVFFVETPVGVFELTCGKVLLRSALLVVEGEEESICVEPLEQGGILKHRVRFVAVTV